MTAAVEYVDTRSPLLRRLLRDPHARPHAIIHLAELDIAEEITQAEVDEDLADIAPHLTEEQRHDQFRELKYVLGRDAIAWADGSGQPDDMSLGAWKADLERRIREHRDALAGGAS